MNRKFILLVGLGGIIAYYLSTKEGQETIRKLAIKAFDMSHDLIKKFEGFSATPYKDVVGKLTIGYGHLVKSWENFSVISAAQADELLRNDTAEARIAVERLVKVPLNENQKSALVSFVFNLGAGNFANSTLLRKLNAGDYAGAANEFPRWVYAGGKVIQGLVNRRNEERALFLS